MKNPTDKASTMACPPTRRSAAQTTQLSVSDADGHYRTDDANYSCSLTALSTCAAGAMLGSPVALVLYAKMGISADCFSH